MVPAKFLLAGRLAKTNKTIYSSESQSEMFSDICSIRKSEKYSISFMYPHRRLHFSTSTAQKKVEFELYLEQLVVDYMCISNLSMNNYYYAEQGPSKLKRPYLALVDPF